MIQFGTAPNNANNLGRLGQIALNSLSTSPSFNVQHPGRTVGPIMGRPVSGFFPPMISPFLNQNSQQVNENQKALTDAIKDGTEEIPYDESTKYMQDLEDHIAEMKKQQEAEEQEILSKKLDDLSKSDKANKELQDKYESYKKEQKEIEKLKEEQNKRLKDTADKGEKPVLQDKQRFAAEIKFREEANRKKLDEVYKGYDKAITKQIEQESDPAKKESLIKDRDGVRSLYERRNKIEALEKDFQAIKQEYFIDPQTEDWSKTKIKDGYSKALRELIRPKMEALKSAFDRKEQNTTEDDKSVQPLTSYNRRKTDLGIAGPKTNSLLLDDSLEIA